MQCLLSIFLALHLNCLALSDITSHFATCQREDGVGTGAALTRPILLSHTAYDGVLIFADGPENRQDSFVRQFHAWTSTVSTIQALPFLFSSVSGLAASRHGVVVVSQRAYAAYSATQLQCPSGTSSLPGNAIGATGCQACPPAHYTDAHYSDAHYSDAAAGECRPCTAPSCALPGQLLVPCQLDTDAYCGACTNKPSINSRYVGASSIPGTSQGGGDCPWVYTAPCPVGYYSVADGACALCPP